MKFQHFAKRLRFRWHQMYTDSFRHKLVIIASAVIFFTFALSIYAFIIDIVTDYSKDQEALHTLAQHLKTQQTEEEIWAAQKPPEKDHGFSKPQGGATPVTTKAQ